jgi:hypothetical protein
VSTQREEGSPPTVTVVIAAMDDGPTLTRCLESIVGQLESVESVESGGSGGTESSDHQRGFVAELLVVASFAIPPAVERWVEGGPRVSWVVADSELTPVLWARGMGAARGDYVALSTSHFCVASDWLSRIVAAHQGGAAVVGGAFELGESASGVETAVFWLRYGAYPVARGPGPVVEVAADNASYSREALLPHREVWVRGFWEPELHRLLVAADSRIEFDPTVRVRQQASEAAWSFCRQRLRHGRRFGVSRARRFPRPIAAFACVYSILLPLIAGLLFVRTLSQVLGGRASLGWRQDSAPESSAPVFAAGWLFLFAVCWAVGEVLGVLEFGVLGRSPADVRTPD